MEKINSTFQAKKQRGVTKNFAKNEKKKKKKMGRGGNRE